MIEFIECFYSSRIEGESFIKTAAFHPTHDPPFTWSKESGALLGGGRSGKVVFIF